MDLNYLIPGHLPIPSKFKFPNPVYALPNIPPGYGSNLYPAENLDPDNLPAMEMEEISRNCKSNELSSFIQSKKPNHISLRVKHRKDEYYCSICSEYPSFMVPGDKIVRHRHNSSKFIKMYSAPPEKGRIQLHNLQNYSSLS